MFPLPSLTPSPLSLLPFRSDRWFEEEMGREARKGYLGNYAPPWGRGKGEGPVGAGWASCLGEAFFSKTPPSPYHYLSTSEVVWNGILLSGDVCHPIIRVDVIDTKEVQTVQTEPDILKDCVAMAVVIV